MDKWVTVIVGLMLFISVFLFNPSKKEGSVDWLYIILGLVITGIGILRFLGLKIP